MSLVTLCIEGTKGAGKSSTIEKLTQRLKASGYEVEICAPFTLANQFAQARGFAGAREMISASKQDNIDEIEFIGATMAQARTDALGKERTGTKPVVLIYDRGWMTVFPHLFGGRWHYEDREQREEIDKIWAEVLADAPATMFLHASFEVTKQRRSKPDVLGGLDTAGKLRGDVEGRRAFADQHADKIALSFNTGEVARDDVVAAIEKYVRDNTKRFVALYGGSFNLSTLAHRAVGAAVRDVVKPDEVWYVVSPQNPHKEKEHMADFRDRVEMAKLNVCGMTKLVVTDIEKEISEATGSTASSDTLRELIARNPSVRFAWVVGADAFTKLHTWHNFEFIIRNAPIIVMPRAGYMDKIADCPAAHYADCPELTDPEDLKTRNGWYVMRQFPEGKVSATEERTAINEGREPDRSSIHPAVIDYIAQRGLRF